MLRTFRIWLFKMRMHLRLDDLARMGQLRVLDIEGASTLHVHSRTNSAGVDLLPLVELRLCETHVLVDSPTALTE